MRDVTYSIKIDIPSLSLPQGVDFFFVDRSRVVGDVISGVDRHRFVAAVFLRFYAVFRHRRRRRLVSHAIGSRRSRGNYGTNFYEGKCHLSNILSGHSQQSN